MAQYTLYLSLALLVVGFIWSIRNTDPDKALIGWIILIPSFFLVQLSIYMANKWGKSPRPDEIISQSLKGLNDDYTFYNYTTAVPHLLVGPQGMWIINPYYHKGEISFDNEKSRYHQKGGAGIIGEYFGQEGLPRITKEAQNLIHDLESDLRKKAIKHSIAIKLVNVFYSDQAKIIGKNFPFSTLKAEKLKSFIRREAKKNQLSSGEIQSICGALPPVK